MTTSAYGDQRSLPLLAFVFNPRSFATMSIVEAATGVCDLLWVVDSTNAESAQMSRLLRRLGQVVDIAGLDPSAAATAIGAFAPTGILALADAELARTADLAQRLGLPFHTPEIAARLTDKFVQRRALGEGGLVVPGSWLIGADTTDPEWRELRDAASFPVVLKPQRGDGSRDTLLAASFDELGRLFDETKEQSHPRAFVVEEYIADAEDGTCGDGFADYVSVESFMCASHITHLAVTGRMPQAPPFRETGFFTPSALDAGQLAEVLAIAGRAATAVGVELGFLHTEIKFTPTGPVVIEVNGRVGGGVPELISAAAGPQILSTAMRLALGDTVVCEEMPPCERLAYLFYVQAPATMRMVTGIEGVEALREFDGVEEVVLKRGPGQSVDWREGNHGNVLTVFGTTRDHDGLRGIYDQVTSTVRISGT